jgi:hypothetical protein
MAEQPVKPDPVAADRRRLFRVGALLGAIALMLSGAMALAYFEYFTSGLGPPQPIPFSHRFHVSTKRVSCMMCHNGAVNTDRAGVPPLETCMLCHKRIIVDYPEIEKLREHYEANRPVRWAHVNNRVPEFVYFSHQRHVRSGIDCGQCHGDIAGMDRVATPQQFQMGFCVQCHRDNNVSHDCYICHR